MTCRQLVKGESPVSVLGLGTIRLPHRRTAFQVDEARASEIVLRAIELGVNYIDTGHFYLGGRCEEFLGRTLTREISDHVDMVTKMPIWLVANQRDLDRIFEEQLRRLRQERLKYYMLHGLNSQTWQIATKMGVLAWLDEKRKRGIIRHVGFSFHDDYRSFLEIVDGYDGWEFCQLQCNYIEPMRDAGLKGIREARRRGLGVVVMAPLFGGMLANLPQDARYLIKSAVPSHTPVSLALQWLWDRGGVTTVLSGISSVDEVIANAETANGLDRKRLGALEHRVVRTIRRLCSAMQSVQCTGCGYCMPCSNGIDIPRNLKLLNMTSFFQDLSGICELYSELPVECRAEECIGCKCCILRCPRRIDIPSWLRTASAVFGQGAKGRK